MASSAFLNMGQTKGDDWYTVHFPNWNWTDATLVPDTLDPSNTVAEVRDDDPARSVSAAASERIPMDRSRTYTLRWRARIGGGRPPGEDDYLVLLQSYDGSGDWIPGANIGFVGHGDGAWRTETRSVDPLRFHPSTASVRLRLFARRWTPAGELLGTTWFDDVMLSPDGGITNLVANPGFDILRAQDVTVRVDFTRFDAAAGYALDTLGFDSFRLRLPYFAQGSAMSGYRTPRILNFDWGTPEYEIVFSRMLRLITDHLASKGWLDRAYAYWADEPQPGELGLVQQGMEILRRADPRLRRLLTLNIPSDEAMHEAVDIWTPAQRFYRPELAAEQRAW